MKRVTIATLLFTLAAVAEAKDKPVFEKGILLQMDSSSCGYAEKDGKTIAGQIFGTTASIKTQKKSFVRNISSNPTASSTAFVRKMTSIPFSCLWGKPRNFAFTRTK